MKNNIKVLVIDNNKSMTKDIEKYFSSHEVIEVVACKNDGEEGLHYILNNEDNIDVIVMDLVLAKLDGLFILGELETRRIRKNIIITTSFNDENILEEASKYGINYYMLKPVNFISLEKRIISTNLQEERPFNHEEEVIDLLHKLGVPSHIRGYQYIKEGVAIVYRNGNHISYITKDVYPEIARKFGTTTSRVERAIRHAIEVGWNRGDVSLMEDVFGNSIDINRDKPTNAEYLTTIADRIKINSKLLYN